MPKGEQRSNREKKKPKKQRAPVPVARRVPGLPYNPYDRKTRSTAALQIT